MSEFWRIPDAENDPYGTGANGGGSSNKQRRRRDRDRRRGRDGRRDRDRDRQNGEGRWHHDNASGIHAEQEEVGNHWEIKKLQRNLVQLLRHDASKLGLYVRPNGYVDLDEVLALDRLKKYGATCEDVQVACDTEQCHRLSFRRVDGVNQVRANNGHTLKEVTIEHLAIPIASIEEMPGTTRGTEPYVVHGTYFGDWNGAKASGILPVKRNWMNFLPLDRLHQMRDGLKLLVYVDAAACMRDGMKFYVDGSGSILSQCLQGGIRMKYVYRVARFHKRANGDPEISHVVYKAEDHQRLQNEGQNDGNDDYPVYGEDDNEMKDLNVPARPNSHIRFGGDGNALEPRSAAHKPPKPAIIPSNHQNKDSSPHAKPIEYADESKEPPRKSKRDDEEDKNLCQICFEKQRDTCIIGCGHFYYCFTCLEPLKSCPTCRKPLTQLQRMFF